METWRALLGPSADAMGFSAGGAYALTEIGRNAMVIAHSVQKWLEDRRRKRFEDARAKGRAEGREEGREEALAEGEATGLKKGREEERMLWREWNARREDAEARGESFSEPPPNGKI